MISCRKSRDCSFALQWLLILLLIPLSAMMSSCKDDYAYDNEEPNWLGDNMYEWLHQKGEYNVYLKLIEKLDLDETLKRTGSKTLFPASDAAFADYFKRIGESGSALDIVDKMSRADANYLFNSSMLNMAYLDNMLANVSTSDADDESGEGTALVRSASSTIYDKIQHYDPASLPETEWWTNYSKKGIWLVDNQARPNVIFTPAFMEKRQLTSSDWGIISQGQTYDEAGFYINGSHVSDQNKNITCKNGYIHIAEDVVAPLPNMAEIIERDSRTGTFAKLMNKFSAPYYDAGIDETVKNDEMSSYVDDSVFVRRYFNDNGSGACTSTPATAEREAETIADDKLLYFDPSYNTMNMPADMCVMFVPTDEAMKAYFASANGDFLRKVYGEWDNVPLDVLCKFIKNHQLKSFIGSLPHEWYKLADQKGNLMGVTTENIVGSTQGCNGLVYFTNTVFPPIDYKCAYAPTLTSPITRVMKSAIDENDALKFHLYLRSLENQYNLLVPTDEAVKYYCEPISWSIYANTGVDNREIWSFKVINDRILADVYGVDENGEKGALKKTIGSSNNDQNKIQNRLRDILDMHIVVADTKNEPMSGFMDQGDKTYYLTKGGTVIQRTAGSGEGIEIEGAGDKELGLPASKLVDNIYVTTNSHTFFIDRILQDPMRSVYTTLQANPSYSKFFELLLGEPAVYSYFKNDDDIQPIFDQQTTESSSGIGQIVTSFNNYRYTILVPTNDAIDAAFKSDHNLWTWEQILMEDDDAIKKTRCQYLLNFLRSHFIDGAVPVGTGSWSRTYYTAARYSNGQFKPINVTSTDEGVQFGGASGTSVITSDESNYNIWARDLIVDNKDPQKADNILASSRAVIHLVDHVAPYNE